MALVLVVSWLKNYVRMKTCPVFLASQMRWASRYTVSCTFAKFFSKLFSPDPSLNEVELTTFLSKANVSQIPQPLADSLDSQIKLTELKEALLNMKTGKSPGLDGIPPEVFLTFWAQLGYWT